MPNFVCSCAEIIRHIPEPLKALKLDYDNMLCLSQEINIKKDKNYQMIRERIGIFLLAI